MPKWAGATYVLYPDSTKIRHDVQTPVPSTHNATRITMCLPSVLRHSHTSLCDTWVAMLPHTTIPLPHNSHALTHGTTHKLPYTAHQDTPAHDPTCLTHAITRQLECRHLSHGQLHVGPSGTLVTCLSISEVLPGPRRGSCNPSQT